MRILKSKRNDCVFGCGLGECMQTLFKPNEINHNYQCYYPVTTSGATQHG